MSRNRVIINAILILLIISSLLVTNSCTLTALNPGETTGPADEDNTNDEEKKLLEEVSEKEKKAEKERLEEERSKREEEKRRLREEALKKELGPFFVPLPPLEQEENPSVKVRGLYLTGNTVGLESRFNKLLELVKTTELNAMVIDVKNDHGLMSYKSEIEIVEEVGANRSVPIKDMKRVMQELKRHDIYPIARIVVFKDPNLPEKCPEWGIQKKEGGLWRDNKGIGWVNPYNKKVWDYNIAIAKEAALMGFREIQFDYVRFPENARRVDKEAYYPGADGRSKEEVIAEFIDYAREQLEEYNIHIAADTFGVIATSWGDSDQIGQNWELIAPRVDYNCPMIYPSHYGPGYFGYAVPDAHPEETIRKALTDSLKRNASVKNPGIIRPWLQGFTATWIPGHIPYGPNEIRLQIDTALEMGIEEYLIWNPKNRYFENAFRSAEETAQKEKELQRKRDSQGRDLLGKTALEAAKDFLEVFQKKDWREALYLHSANFELDHDKYRSWF
ncbi:MAG: putative glycoside hydrolase, partial [Dethiobacteria bacterium]